MPKIYVKKAFTLNCGGEQRHFPVGPHTVAADVAEHWYAKAHIGDPEPLGASELAADELLAELAKREKALTEREKTAEQRDAELAKREEAVTAREKAAGNAVAAEKSTAQVKK